jgi:hypothetical protein
VNILTFPKGSEMGGELVKRKSVESQKKEKKKKERSDAKKEKGERA